MTVVVTVEEIVDEPDVVADRLTEVESLIEADVETVADIEVDALDETLDVMVTDAELV